MITCCCVENVFCRGQSGSREVTQEAVAEVQVRVMGGGGEK
jgi:hypothetical protein